MISFTGHEPYQALAHHFGFARIACQENLRGEGVPSPDDGRSGTAYPFEFTVTLKSGERLMFVCPTEWERGGRFYRLKDQRGYVERMLTEISQSKGESDD